MEIQHTLQHGYMQHGDHYHLHGDGHHHHGSDRCGDVKVNAVYEENSAMWLIYECETQSKEKKKKFRTERWENKVNMGRMAPAEPNFLARGKKNKAGKEGKKKKEKKPKGAKTKQMCKVSCLHASDSYTEMRTENYPYIPKSGDREITNLNCIDKQWISTFDDLPVHPNTIACVADPCDTDNGGCDPNATCDTNLGVTTCVCNEGFVDGGQGDGLVCDANPCATSDNGGCDPNATCSVVSGAASCVCNPGFSGDGATCLDYETRCVNTQDYTVDLTTEALELTKDECHIHCTAQGREIMALECPGVGTAPVNTATCYCYDMDAFAGTETYTGNEIDAANCEGDPSGNTDISSGVNGSCGGPYIDGDGFALGGQNRAALYWTNPCNSGNGGCDINAACTNTAGVASCACSDGYQGDGTTCDSKFQKSKKKY